MTHKDRGYRQPGKQHARWAATWAHRACHRPGDHQM